MMELNEDELAWVQGQLAQAMAGQVAGGGVDDSWADPTGGLLSHLLEACSTGDIDVVHTILEARQEQAFDINLPGPDGDTALHIACLYGHERIVELLQSVGANAAVQNAEDGSTPLHDAAATGDLGIVKRLLAAAPQHVHTADSDGDTPLHNAARGTHLEIVKVLLEAGADKTLSNGEGHTAAQEVDEEEEGAEDIIALLQAA